MQILKKKKLSEWSKGRELLFFWPRSSEPDLGPSSCVSSVQTSGAVAPLLVPPRFCSGRRQQQRPLLRHRAALHHASLRHHLHRLLQVEDEQGSGLHHVPALLHLPGPQRDAGGPHHHLSSFHLITAGLLWNHQQDTGSLQSSQSRAPLPVPVEPAVPEATVATPIYCQRPTYFLSTSGPNGSFLLVFISKPGSRV